jgi:16S rRNA (guanine966-N2)-methyltransferase
MRDPLRIVAGALAGQGTLADLGKGDPAAHLRPTTDRVRESLFNLLTNGRFGDLVTGARVLDLFAGTGALGLEALSRGAVHATFVDDGGAARALLRDNIGRCAAQGVTKVFRSDATALGDNRGQSLHAHLPRPALRHGPWGARHASAQDGGWLAPGATIVWEEEAPPLPPPGFELLDERRYGGTSISLLRAP